MKNTQAVTVVDAFTDMPFSGNPAAVCILESWPDETMLHNIAREMNLSETAYVAPRADGGFDLRWFTPSCEVDLCGHATIATTHALLEAGRIAHGVPVHYHTRSGVLTALAMDGQVELDFPAQAGKKIDISFVQGCLGVKVEDAAFNGVNFLAVVEDLMALRGCSPDMTAIAQLPAQGLIVTTATGCGAYDFASRYFAPQVGVPEDPVCGSAHCMLAPYWAEVLKKKRFRALQASQRGGVVEAVVNGARVTLIGQAVTTLRGELELERKEEGHALDHAA